MCIDIKIWGLRKNVQNIDIIGEWNIRIAIQILIDNLLKLKPRHFYLLLLNVDNHWSRIRDYYAPRWVIPYFRVN